MQLRHRHEIVAGAIGVDLKHRAARLLVEVKKEARFEVAGSNPSSTPAANASRSPLAPVVKSAI